MSASTNEARTRPGIEAIWNPRELDVADELFAPDYVNHDGLIPDLLLGPEAIKFGASYRRAFRGIPWTAPGAPPPPQLRRCSQG